MKEILLNVTSKEKRCAVLKFGKLQDLIVERKSNRQLTGNIYRGEVINILHNIQSAFIAINEGENGFIHISDIVENTQKFQEMFDMEFDWDCDVSAIKTRELKDADISKFMEIGHPVLVQVVKEPIGSKGARLTSNITIPGRYLVLLPNTPHRGVSRKIIDRSERERLKKIIKSFEMPQKMGLICRTASASASTEELIAEATELLNAWEKIQVDFKESEGPVCLYRESDLVKKSVLKAINKKYTRMLVDDHKTYLYCREVYNRYKGDHVLKLECYRDKIPMFDRFAVENEIERCLRRKIWLQSGGYLFFDKTEAMYTIDVNSGRGSASKENINVEETLVRINMEAADEIARQLRIRNIGGLVICDFIDMRYRRNQRRVLDTLKEAMKEDSAKCTILGMSDFGLVEMTRQRTRESLIQTLFTHCPYCSGKGIIKNFESISIEIERAIQKLMSIHNESKVELITHPQLNDYLGKGDKSLLEKLAKNLKGEISFKSNDELHLNGFEFYSMADGQKSNGNIQALLAKIDELSGSKELPEKYTQILKDFIKSYQKVIRDHGEDPESHIGVFYSFIEFMKEQVRNPFQFEPYHKKMRSPVDYYKFGLDFLRPLVDLPNSTISGAKNLDYIESLLEKKENVILFANHQIEADPHAISILLEKTHPKFGEELIFVAGTRVTTDPFAIPFSMGRNLLCIHSKKYIEHPPEEQHEKQMHNKRTMARMVELLSEGGHAIYVAPSGGRDRVNADGIIEVAPFDPQSLGMYYVMVQKAKKPTHFFPLSLSTYHLLPPPDTTETELGESRITRGGAIHLHFGEEIDMEHFPGAEKAKDKKDLRRIRAEYLWECVNREYEKFPK